MCLLFHCNFNKEMTNFLDALKPMLAIYGPKFPENDGMNSASLTSLSDLCTIFPFSLS